MTQTQEVSTNEVAQQTRERGVWVILAKNAEGALIFGERKTKREALGVIEAAGSENIVAIYKLAKKVELKTTTVTKVSF